MPHVFLANLRLLMIQGFVYQFWAVHLEFTLHVMRVNMVMMQRTTKNYWLT